MEQIKITEVGPRDGLQNEKTILSTQDKFEFVSRLVESGFKHIELTSFVRKDRIPQMGDASELAKLILPKYKNQVQFSSLTPNAKGYEGAKEAGFSEVAVFTATSETFTKKNINMTIEESLDFFKPIFSQAKSDGIKVRGYISTVIACPYEGKIKPEKTLEVAERLLDAGVYEISLGETIGVAVPSEVESLLEVLLKKILKINLQVISMTPMEWPLQTPNKRSVWDYVVLIVRLEDSADVLMLRELLEMLPPKTSFIFYIEKDIQLESNWIPLFLPVDLWKKKSEEN